MGKDRILVVDDDPDNRAMIAHFLTNWGYAVDDAKNGKVALEKVLASPPELVLLDLEMPEMDGFETCERLKTNPETEWIPVIIFTGLEKMPHRIRGFRHGADDYVVKTVEPDELRTRIELVLKRTKKYSSLAGLNEKAPAAAREAVPKAPAPEPPAAAVSAAPVEAPTPTPARSAPSASPPRQAEAGPELPNPDLAVSLSLSRIPFPEAMRLVLAHGKHGIVEIKNGTRQGAVHLSEGGVIHARVDDETGEDAFYELALWRQGRFDFQDKDAGSEHTIHTSARSLLVEASRRLDAWNMISSKVPSFDLVPKWVPLSGAKSIRLTKSDWALIRLVDGRRTIRQIVDSMRTDIFEAGRVVYSLITVGVLRLDEGPDPRDDAFDLVALRGDQVSVGEPFQLTSTEWLLLSRVDDHRDLGAIRDSLDVPPTEFMKLVRGLKEKGFLKLAGRERRPPKEA